MKMPWDEHDDQQWAKSFEDWKAWVKAMDPEMEMFYLSLTGPERVWSYELCERAVKEVRGDMV